MHSLIQPNRHVVFRLPSDALKIVEIIPNTSISVGKYGSFPANSLLGRPLYATYEILEDGEQVNGKPKVRLRVVPPSELNTEATFDTGPQDDPSAGPDSGGASTPEQNIDEEAVVVKNNRMTVDDASRQSLSMLDIEQLKKAVTGNGREIIEKIMSSHQNLDEKTVFSLAKYTLRKAKKYLRRFTVLPVDPARLAQYTTWDREANRIMELKEESLGLITAWSNIHYTPEIEPGSGGGKWLVIDDTGGLLVATLAEKLGILYPPDETTSTPAQPQTNGAPLSHGNPEDTSKTDSKPATSAKPQARPAPPRHPPLATRNTIHVLHPASQPNLSLLKYFSYDSNRPSPSHPLTSHLHALTWLQLLHPAEDNTYAEPPPIPQPELEKLKPAKRSNYHRKRRRWLRCKAIVDGAREGGFDGLVCATAMRPESYLRYLVPLVKGGGHVVLYSPTVERLVGAVDLYSRERRAAYLELLARWRAEREQGPAQKDGNGVTDEEEGKRGGDEGFDPDPEDFPVDPRLLLGCSIQTSRARQWQVLPGRTHPLMTDRGGGEGYVFTARRVIPYEGKVEARGNFAKKRKTAPT